MGGVGGGGACPAALAEAHVGDVMPSAMFEGSPAHLLAPRPFSYAGFSLCGIP